MPDIHALRTRPLVYSCSGCSDAAQTANYYALKLTQEERAEMSCIAGVGGGVAALVKQAQSGRIIWAIDGCAMHCVKACLEKVHVTPNKHVTLSDLSIKKHKHQLLDMEQANQHWPALLVELEKTEQSNDVTTPSAAR